MTKKTVLYVMIGALSLTASPVLAVVDFNNGGIYNIDYPINESVRVDYEAPGMQTTVNLLEGGVITDRYYLEAYENSHVNVLGGFAGHGLNARGNSQVDVLTGLIRDFSSYDNSQVAISGGYISELKAYNSSHIVFSGGHINSDMWASDSSQVDISGGVIGSYLVFWDSAIVTIDGSNFAVDGQVFGYGELASIYGGSTSLEPVRRLTGTLVSGEPIDNHFYIGHDAKIILVPEPTTIALLALGILGLRKRMV